MSDQKTEEKIEKFAAKRKSGSIIKLLGKADSDVLVKALEALGGIGDEDACNHITHYLDHENEAVRIAACRAAVGIGTGYMNTRVRHQLAMEKNEDVKKQIQEILNSAKKTDD